MAFAQCVPYKSVVCYTTTTRNVFAEEWDNMCLNPSGLWVAEVTTQEVWVCVTRCAMWICWIVSIDLGSKVMGWWCVIINKSRVPEDLF